MNQNKHENHSEGASESIVIGFRGKDFFTLHPVWLATLRHFDSNVKEMNMITQPSLQNESDGNMVNAASV